MTTHTIQFKLNGKTYTAAINYPTDLSLGDVITLLPEMNEESKAMFNDEEKQELSVKRFTPVSVGENGVVKFEEVE